MRYCENCKLHYSDTSRFCQQCGVELISLPDAVDRRKVLSILRKLPGYKKVLENCKIKNYEEEAFFDYIMIHEAGIFVFQICETYRILEGSDRQRFWRAENYNDHSIRLVERPVSVLERQQNILGQVLRKYTFTKTFSFLVFPDNCGLENVQSSKLDQMLTLHRMKDILLRCIRDYGHVYSNADIDRINGLLIPFREVQQEPHNMASSPVIKADKSPHLIRRIGIIILLSTLLLAFLYVHFFQNREKQNKPDKLSGQNAPAISAPLSENNTTSLSIPNKYHLLFDSLRNTDLNTVASAFGFISLTRQIDSSLLVQFVSGYEEKTLTTMRSALDEIIARLFDERQLSNFTSVRTDNYMQFTVFVTSMNLTEAENQLTVELLRFGVLYAALSRANLEDVSVQFYSQAGNLYKTVKAA